jgi:melanoma-associated antigen
VITAGKSQSQSNPVSNSYMLVSRLPDAFRISAILAPSRIQSPAEEAQYVGFYALIVSIITLTGGELSEAKLQRHLSRLNAKDNLPMDKTETILNRMVKQGYLVRVKSRGAAGEDDNVTWFVGPRGKMELAPEAVAGLVREVYGASSEDLEKRLQASLKIQPRQVGRAQADGREGRNGDGQDEEQVAEDGKRRRAEPRRSGRRRQAQESEEDEDEDDEE